MKFFVSLSFFLFITDSFSQNTQPDFENDSTTYIDFWIIDIYTTDSAMMATNWMMLSRLSEDILNAYEDSLKTVQDTRTSNRDSLQMVTTNFETETDTAGQNNDAEIFSAGSDSLLPIWTPTVAYCPCNVLYDVNLVTQKGVEINYSCSDHILAAYVYDYNTYETGKVKWEIDLKKLGNPYMNKIEFSGDEKFDIVIELIDETRYLVNSQNGRVKVVE